MSSIPQVGSDKTRRKRQSRNKNSTLNTSSADEGGTQNDIPITPKSKKSHKRRDPVTTGESTLSRQVNGSNEEMTPPRNNTRSNQASDVISSDGQRNNRRRNKNNQQNDQAVHTPGAKRPTGQHATSNTPSKPIAEAAYAGPTFHASPAPSALPIPKFLSKSAPSNDQEVGIGARLAQEAELGSGSDQAPESPSRYLSPKSNTTNIPVQSPALFDMLINADRQEKARQRATNDQSPVRFPETIMNSNQNQQRPKHGRTLTAGSVFPIDMDTSSGRSTPTLTTRLSGQPTQQDSTNRNGYVHLYGTNDDGIKRTLFSSPPSYPGNQLVSAQSIHQRSSPAWASSPDSRTNTSPYGTPSSTSSVNDLAMSSRQAPISPYTQPNATSVNRRSQYSSHSNSSLRRELVHGQYNLHGTSSSTKDFNEARNTHEFTMDHPSRNFSSEYPLDGSQSPCGSNGGNPPARNHSPGVNPNATLSTRFSPQDALKASLGKVDSTATYNVAGMENELRKILRIDELRATSATAPP